MKNYMIFVGDRCYPMGGMDDFLVDAASLEDAIEIAKTETKAPNADWAHVYSVLDGRIVWRTGKTLYSNHKDNIDLIY